MLIVLQKLMMLTYTKVDALADVDAELLLVSMLLVLILALMLVLIERSSIRVNSFCPTLTLLKRLKCYDATKCVHLILGSDYFDIAKPYR